MITGSNELEALLKTWYRDGVESLFFRTSPVVKNIDKVRVGGKEQAFAAMYGRGGAVSSKATQATAKAATNSKNAEFKVTGGQRFSIFTYNAKEVQASLSKKGAYMKLAGAKAFAAAQALRQTLAADFYGRGFGEFAVLGSANAAIVAAASANDSITLTLPNSVIMKIDVDSDLIFKTSVAATTENGLFTVTAIQGNEVTGTLSTAYAGAGATDVIALRGSMDASGNPNAPMGLDGWLPIVKGRDNTDATWNAYKATTFYGVNRSVNTDALMGNFYYKATNTKKADDIIGLLMACRRRGLDNENTMIVMNDADFKALADEIQTSNTYFTKTSTAEQRKANVGLSGVTAGFNTSHIDEFIIDDPYCPEGKFYILDKSTVEFWSMTNAETVQADGIEGNNPGKQNPEEYEDKGKENDPFKLLVDDFVSIAPGAQTDDGDAVRVTYNVFGSFVVTNPSVNGVGIFHDYTPANVIGYAG